MCIRDRPTTTKKKKKKHTTTQPQVVYRTERNGTVAPAAIRETTESTVPKRPADAHFDPIPSDDGYYWDTASSRDDPLEEIYVDESGRHFYFKKGDKSTPRIYID